MESEIMDSTIMDSEIMESDLNWLHLPDSIWELIMIYLNFEDLLNASVICKNFNDFISMSPFLMKKICFTIGKSEWFRYSFNNVPTNLCLESFCKLKLMNDCLQKSKRKYHSIKIFSLDDRSDEKYVINLIFDILKKLAGSVKQITFFKAALQDDFFINIIQIMKNLKVVKFEGQVFHPTEAITEIVRLAGRKRKHLKVLCLKNVHGNSLFRTDKIANNIKMSLDELHLHAVAWNDNEIAMKFFKTQTNLKKVTLHFENPESNIFNAERYEQILIHLFGNNLQLKTVILTTKGRFIDNFKDMSFLEGTVNPTVENLTLNLDPSHNAPKLISTFIKLFPNVKNFNYGVLKFEVIHGLDQLHNWSSLESINCKLVDINQLFRNTNFGEKLTTCIINCTFYFHHHRQQVIEFLTRHQNIKHMSLNLHCKKIFSDEICFLFINTLKSLESFKFEGNYLCLSNYLE